MNIIALSLGRKILVTGSREQRRMEEYAVHLDELHVIVLTRTEHGFHKVVHIGNLHLYPTNARNRFTMLVAAYTIGRQILKQSRGACTVTAQDPFEIGFVSYLLAKSAAARFHIQLHGDYFGASAWGRGSVVHAVRRVCARRILPKACSIRVVSLRIKRSLQALGIPETRIVVLPIRPVVEQFLETPRNVREDHTVSFLMASRFAPEKNISLALCAFATITKKFPQARLTLMGEGSEEKHIRARIRRLGIVDRVTVCPWTEHLEQAMAAADVFVLSSNHEAYGLTLIEAMATGLPLITTDVGCVGEVVQDGVHGVVVPIEDEIQLSHAMERMIREPEFKIACGLAGKRDVQKLVGCTQEEYAKAWVAAHSCREDRV